jgi:hypothetical protein
MLELGKSAVGLKTPWRMIVFGLGQRGCMHSLLVSTKSFHITLQEYWFFSKNKSYKNTACVNNFFDSTKTKCINVPNNVLSKQAFAPLYK